MLFLKLLLLSNALRINISQVCCLLVLFILISNYIIEFNVYFLYDYITIVFLAIRITKPYLITL
jgi:hypothetical protein